MNRLITVLVGALVLTFSASCQKDPHTIHEVQTRQGVETTSHLLDAESFDMAAVTQMVKGGQGATNTSALETAINNPANGINNVDIDNDGIVDPIAVVETRSAAGGVQLNFNAIPSSKAANATENDVVLIAFLTFTHNTTSNTMNVVGGYPDYVRGYDSYYYGWSSPYVYTPGLTRTYFTMRLMDRMMRPSYVYPRYNYGGYYKRHRSYRPVKRYTPQVRQERRTTYRKTHTVSPVAKKRPATWKQPKFANKVKSRYTGHKVGTGTVSGGKGKMKSFAPTTKPKYGVGGSWKGSGSKGSTRSRPSTNWAPNRSKSKTKTNIGGRRDKGSNWGSSKSRAKTKSRGWGGSRSKTKSRGWGGSRSKTKSRGFGGSRSKSRGWGGSRSRSKRR